MPSQDLLDPAPSLFEDEDTACVSVPPARYDAMPDPGGTPASAITVATLTAATRDILEGAVPPVWVRGEVVGFKEHRSGHWYFTLKDAEAQIRCVAWASDARRFLAAPDEGMAVIVRGQLTVFPGRGELQFRVRALEGVGEGLWRKALEVTRARLEADGLLAAERKRSLPFLPRCIAVVTSTDGAALHDVAAVIRRRCPATRIVAVEATVQGREAAASVRAALARVCRWGGADLVIVGRGGGSREDLWAFNDERLARAVADMPVPVISAVGHEIDVTLCDLVADWRAPTPSAAAEAAVPQLADLVRQLGDLRDALGAAVLERLGAARQRLRVAGGAVSGAAAQVVERRGLRLQGLGGRLDALSPLATLARGYAVLHGVSGQAITSTSGLAAGDRFMVRLRDGRVDGLAERVEPGPPLTPATPRAP
ncbi:MAG TPA: exodeoxyribonuclease VII large subunit [Gemmatimonadaceae bacterium]|nr:exodeoxyribonuclease VII large subunit [Gemmatimonadaceae bacterium]